MQSSAQALLFLLLCCTAQPASSLAPSSELAASRAAEASSWPWSRKTPAPAPAEKAPEPAPVEKAPEPAPVEETPPELAPVAEAAASASEETPPALEEKSAPAPDLEAELAPSKTEPAAVEALEPASEEAEPALDLRPASKALEPASEKAEPVLQDLLPASEQAEPATEKASAEPALEDPLPAAEQAEPATEKASEEASGEASGSVGAPAPAREPTRPGCYMRMASGCPSNPMETAKWRRDTYAERRGFGTERCHKRKSTWNTYCGSEDAQMVFVASETRSEPLSALQISATWQWPWSKKAAEEKQPETPAPEAERATLDADKESTVKSPTRPGCYMRMPSGCPKTPMQTQLWRHDTWAEQKGLDEAGCQKREAVWNSFCESQDAAMAFVPGQ